MHEWGDVKFFLATARGGSTLRAARELGVSQTTVARRIASLESALSIRLFDRRRHGYRLSEAGAAILADAERVAAEAETFERVATRHRRQLSGVLRVTTVEIVANEILTPWLAEFIELYPDIKVEVIATERCLDLHRGEADIAIRATSEPTEPGMIMRKLADGRFALYCSRSYAAKHGAPTCAADLNSHFVIGVEAPLANSSEFAWLAEVAPHATVRTVCSTFFNAVAAVKSGHGVFALPSTVAVYHTDLIECFVIPGFEYVFYLVWPEPLKDLPRVKAFTKFILSRVPALKRALEEGPGGDRDPKPAARAARS